MSWTLTTHGMRWTGRPGYDTPGVVRSRVEYAALCPAGHEALWTTTRAEYDGERTHATYRCPVCPPPAYAAATVAVAPC